MRPTVNWSIRKRLSPIAALVLLLLLMVMTITPATQAITANFADQFLLVHLRVVFFFFFFILAPWAVAAAALTAKQLRIAVLPSAAEQSTTIIA